MSKISRMIKKVFGKAIYLEPIADQNIYVDNMESYSGNSLEEKNILIVMIGSGLQKNMEEVERQFRIERANVKTYVMEDVEVSVQTINALSGEMIGPFDHIINLIDTEHFDTTEGVYVIYNLLQAESDYLIELPGKGTLCTAVITDNAIIRRTVRTLVHGLGNALGAHSIIENGLSASRSVPVIAVVRTAVYLSGKYGHILAGEFLALSEGCKDESIKN